MDSTPGGAAVATFHVPYPYMDTEIFQRLLPDQMGSMRTSDQPPKWHLPGSEWSPWSTHLKLSPLRALRGVGGCDSPLCLKDLLMLLKVRQALLCRVTQGSTYFLPPGSSARLQSYPVVEELWRAEYPWSPATS